MRSKNDLELFVDRLFANHRKTKAVIDLRNEVLSNLEAKVTDYMQNGMEYQQAVCIAIEDIEAIDNLIDDHLTIYMNRYLYDVAQSTLLYTLLAWIFTIPLRLMPVGMLANNVLILLVVAVGILFFLISRMVKEDNNRTGTINVLKAKKLSGIVWIIWGIYASVITAFTLLTRFGSDLWFGRTIEINGPYALYVIMLELAIPLVTVIIPLALYKADRLIKKHEVIEHE